jgi:hypothetical protein
MWKEKVGGYTPVLACLDWDAYVMKLTIHLYYLFFNVSDFNVPCKICLWQIYLWIFLTSAIIKVSRSQVSYILMCPLSPTAYGTSAHYSLFP